MYAIGLVRITWAHGRRPQPCHQPFTARAFARLLDAVSRLEVLACARRAHPKPGAREGRGRGGGLHRDFPRPGASWSDRARAHRIDLDCIVPYLTLAKSTRLPILLCKINLARAPKRTIRYLMLWYCSFGKMENPGTNVDFAFPSLRRRIPGMRLAKTGGHPRSHHPMPLQAISIQFRYRDPPRERTGWRMPAASDLAVPGSPASPAARVISDCHIILGPIVTFGDRLSPPRQ
jgi:hypothetical protein